MKNNFNFLNRRRLLQDLAVLTGSAAGLVPFGALLAQGAPLQASQLKTSRNSEQVLFVQGPDSNVLVVDSSEGLILVDGGSAAWAAALQGLIAENFQNRPPRALINTHWHPEQTGSNLTLGEQGVEIIAHENTALWLGTEISQRWSNRVYAPLPATALPGSVFYEDGFRQIGDCVVHFGYMREAHTDGDIWVYFENEDVLVTGGLVSNGRWPDIDWWTGGYIGGMLDGFVSLLTVPTSRTRIVPAYGNLMTLDELKVQNQMYLTIFDRLHAAMIRSDSLEDILAARPAAEFDSLMGDPAMFLTLAVQSFKGHFRDPQNFRMLNIP